MENPNWCKNPQLFVVVKKPATIKVIVERLVGRKKQPGVQIGHTVTRLMPASQPGEIKKVKKGERRGMGERVEGSGLGSGLGKITKRLREDRGFDEFQRRKYQLTRLGMVSGDANGFRIMSIMLIILCQ